MLDNDHVGAISQTRNMLSSGNYHIGAIINFKP